MRKVGHYSKARLIENWYFANIENFCDFDCMYNYFDGGEQCSHCGAGETEDLPAGFSILSAGCFRIAFLHAATNVVYKIEHNSGEEEYSNAEEHRNYRRLMRRATNEGLIGRYVRIPIVTRYGNVIAMEYIAQGKGIVPRAAREAVCRIGISDMHMGNWVYDGKRIVPIDLASEYYYAVV